MQIVRLATQQSDKYTNPSQLCWLDIRLIESTQRKATAGESVESRNPEAHAESSRRKGLGWRQINAVIFSLRAQKTLKTNLWICKPTPALIYVDTLSESKHKLGLLTKSRSGRVPKA